MKCPRCKSPRITRRGRRETRFGFRQLFYCRDCRREFTDSKLLYKTYGPKVISSAICHYNLGNTLKESVKLTNKRYKVRLSTSSVSHWLAEFGDVCTYRKLRPAVVKGYQKEKRDKKVKEILVSKTFLHNDLAYNFKYHRPKLEMLCKDNGFSSLIEYVKRFEKGCPSFFDEIENRCSQVRIAVRVKKETRYNNACRLADFALKSCNINSQRHSAVENFMLINDSSTIAVEVPVWLWEKNLDVGVSGHIDVLQVRQGKIFILDFKPEAKRENEQKVASQLFWYASGLSFRTSIPLDKFMCAWFDERAYYEFIPSQADTRFGKFGRLNRVILSKMDRWIFS
jgi:transposase-like protein